jgi:hypothetical protein
MVRSTPQPPTQAARRGLAAGWGWPVRTLTGCLVRAPDVVVGATQCGVCCLSFVERLVARPVGETGGGDIKLASSSAWSRVLGTDAVGGSPNCDVGDCPAVPVFHPVPGGEAESAVVAAGDDHISDIRLIAVGQRHLGCRSGVVESMLPGRRLSCATRCRVGAIMIASRPAARSETQALNASSVVVAMSPTWTRP